MLMFACHSFAEGIYKWTDEKGQVHFGGKPPAPVQDGSVETLRDLNGDAGSSGSIPSRIYGSWYQKIDSRVTREYDISGGSLRIRDYFSNGGGSDVSRGGISISNRTMAVTYFEHENQSMVDQTELFEIVSLSGGQLELLKPNGQRVFARKMLTGRPSDASYRFKGDWYGNEFRLNFGWQTFSINGFYNPKRKEGNWSWDSPILSLDFVVDYSDPVDARSPRVEEWYVESLSEQEMVLIRQANGQKLSFGRSPKW